MSEWWEDDQNATEDPWWADDGVATQEELDRAAEDHRMLQQARGQLERAGSGWKQQAWAISEQIRTGLESRLSRMVTAGKGTSLPSDENADRLVRMGNAMARAISERDPEGFKGFALRSARGAAVTLPEMVAAGAVAGPYGAIGSAVTQEANQAITEGRDIGLEGGELGRYVAAQGAVEAIPAIVMQKLGLGGLETAVGRQSAAKGLLQGLKQAGIQTVEELPEEVVTELGHSFARGTMGKDPNALTPEQIERTVTDTVGQTLVTMGLVELPQIGDSMRSDPYSRKSLRQLGAPEEVVKGGRNARIRWIQQQEAGNAGTASQVVSPGVQPSGVETAGAHAAAGLEPGAGGVARPEGPAEPVLPPSQPEPTADAGQPTGREVNPYDLNVGDSVVVVGEAFEGGSITAMVTMAEDMPSGERAIRVQHPSLAGGKPVAVPISSMRLAESVEATETPVLPEGPKESGEGENAPPEPPPWLQTLIPGNSPEEVGIRNESVTEWREYRGREPVEKLPSEGFGQWEAEAQAKAAEDPEWVPGLIAEFRSNPRTHTPVESAAIGLYLRQSETKLDNLLSEMTQARQEGDLARAAELQTEATTTDVNLQAAQEAADFSGTKAGQALVSRKMRWDDGLSLVKAIRDRGLAKGGEALTPDELADIKQSVDEAKAAQQRAEEIQTEEARTRAHKQIDETLAEVPERLDGRTLAQWNRKDLAKRAESLGLHVGSRKKERLWRLVIDKEAALQDEADRLGVPLKVLAFAAHQEFPRIRDHADRQRQLQEIVFDNLGIGKKGQEYATRWKIWDEQNQRGRDAGKLGFDDIAQAHAEEFSDIIDPWNAEESLWNLMQQEIPTVLHLDSPEVIKAAEDLLQSGDGQGITEDLPEVQQVFGQQVEQSYIGESPRAGQRRKPGTRTKAATERAKASIVAFKEKWAAANVVGFAYDPVQQGEKNLELIEAAVEVIKAHADMVYQSFAEFWSDFRSNVDPKARPVFQQAWNQAMATEDIPGPDVEMDDAASLTKWARDVELALIESGIRDRDTIIEMVQQELDSLIPGVSEMETMHILSAYGQYEPKTYNEAKLARAQINGEIANLVRLDEMENDRPPQLVGEGRRPQSEEERRLTKQVNAKKKELINRGIIAQDSGKLMKSARDASYTAMDNRLKDIQWELQHREEIVKNKGVEFEKDAEWLALRAELDQAMKDRSEMFPKPGMTEAQKIKARERGLDRAIAQVEQELKTGYIGGKEGAKLTSDGIKMREERLEHLRAARDEQRKNDPNYKATIEERQDLAYRRNLMKRRADYRMRIRNKDYAPRKRKTPAYSKETLDELHKVQKVKDRLKRANELEAWRRKSPQQKTLSILGNSWELLRTTLATGEFSGIGRQGGFYLLGRPDKVLQAVPQAFKAMLSKKGQFRIEKELATGPDADFARQAGLVHLSPYEGRTHQEEVFMGEWTKHVPVVAALERFHTTFTNVLRRLVFDAVVATRGGPSGMSLEHAQVLAHMINVGTGRGNFGRFEPAMIAANRVIFSPKFTMSRFQLLTLQPAWTSDKVARNMVLAEYARAGMGALILLGFIALLGELWPDDDEENKPKVSFDPTTSDFGKIRFGDRRLDPWFGLSQMTVFPTRITSAAASELKEAMGGKATYKGVKPRRATWNFLQGKFHPSIGFGLTLAEGENFVGEENELGSLAWWGKSVGPMTWGDIADTLQEDGMKTNVALSAAAMIGMGLQTYDDKPKSQSRRRPSRPRRPSQ